MRNNILLSKPDHCGMRQVAKKLFQTYLCHKKQDVFINGFRSNTSTLTFGVPQGSVLGPLPFLIYINNLYNSLKFCQVHHFANYTNLLHINDSRKMLN